MKTKIMLSMVFVSLFLALTSLNLMSASFTVSQPATLSESINSTFFTITNTNTTNNVTVNIGSFVPSTISDGPTSLNIVQSFTGIVTITNGSIYRVNVSYTGNAESLDFGSYTSKLNVTEGNTTSVVTLNFNRAYSICGSSNIADIDTEISDINVIDGFGKDEDYWYPLDKVEVEISVDNNGDYDVKKIEMKACLWDKNAEECVMDEGDMDISEDNFKLKSNKDTTTILTIKVDSDKLNTGNSEYILYVSATGEIDASSSEPNDGAETCSSDSQDAEIRTDEQFIVLEGIDIPESASCGDVITVNGKAWNIGEDDENDVYATVYNRELGINERVNIGDINSFDSENINFEFQIPANATEVTHIIEIRVYNEDDDLFELDNDDEDESIFTYGIKVQNCKKITPIAAISIKAELSDETPAALIGTQAIIEATVNNTGTITASYSLEVIGEEDWATLVDIDTESFTLNAGESKKVLIYLDIDKNAETGDHEFTIKATSAGTTTNQKVRLTLEKGFTGTYLIDHFRENWFIYVIVLVNVLLIIAIIIVVKSLLTRKS